jgi:hypothetical protein
MADIAVTRFALATGAAGTTQDITISGFGTPSAVMFFAAVASSNNTVTDHSRFAIGFTDGTLQGAYQVRARDARSTASSMYRIHNTSRVITLVSGTSATSHGALFFNSWITDGVRLEVEIAPTDNWIITAVFFSSNVDVKQLEVDLPNNTATHDINTVGFEPDIVFAFTHNHTTNTGTANGTMTFGVAANDGSDTQKCIAYLQSDSVATTGVNTEVLDNRVASQVGDYNITISDFDADGFSYTSSIGPNTDWITFLAIKLPAGHQFKLFGTTVPTSGSINATAPGFTPYFGLMGLLAGPTAVNTNTDTGGSVWSVAAFDAASFGVASVSSADNVTTTIDKSYTNTTLNLLRASDGTIETTSSSYAFESDGWDITLTANPATAILGFGLAIGEASSGGKSIVSVSPATLDDGETGIVITVSGITTAGASVYINGVAQTVTGTTSNTITFTAERSTLSLGNAQLTVVEA